MRSWRRGNVSVIYVRRPWTISLITTERTENNNEYRRSWGSILYGLLPQYPQWGSNCCPAVWVSPPRGEARHTHTQSYTRSHTRVKIVGSFNTVYVIVCTYIDRNRYYNKWRICLWFNSHITAVVIQSVSSTYLDTASTTLTTTHKLSQRVTVATTVKLTV